jgi:hypothetical protein
MAIRIRTRPEWDDTRFRALLDSPMFRRSVKELRDGVRERRAIAARLAAGIRIARAEIALDELRARRAAVRLDRPAVARTTMNAPRRESACSES